MYLKLNDADLVSAVLESRLPAGYYKKRIIQHSPDRPLEQHQQFFLLINVAFLVTLSNRWGSSPWTHSYLSAKVKKFSKTPVVNIDWNYKPFRPTQMKMVISMAENYLFKLPPKRQFFWKRIPKFFCKNSKTFSFLQIYFLLLIVLFYIFFLRGNSYPDKVYPPKARWWGGLSRTRPPSSPPCSET